MGLPFARLLPVYLIMSLIVTEKAQEASAVYGAIDMAWAKLVGQIAQAYG